MSKQKKSGREAQAPAKPVGGMAIAAGWPIHEVLLSQGWEEAQALAIVLIARRSPNSGKVAAGSFLVDLARLGVKSAQVRLHKSVAEYTAGLRAHITGRQTMLPASFNLAAKIVFTGLEYAADLGFKPDPVFAQARPLLTGADPAAEPTPVRPGGPEGKPFFINGPYDNVERVIAQLRQSVGEGNFHYLLSAGPNTPMLLSDDELGDDDGR